MRTQLIDITNLYFALASLATFLIIHYVFKMSTVTALLFPFCFSMALEVFLYYRPIGKQLSGFALFTRITTSVIPNLILFFWICENCL